MFDLDSYTDEEVMRPSLQRLSFVKGCSILGVQVMHALRRAPRRNPASETCRIAVAYRLITRVASYALQEQIVYGKVYHTDTCERSASMLGPEWLRDADMLAWRYPHDPGLPQLPALLDSARERGTSVELVSYRPEERATLRLVAAHRHVAYAKTFRSDEGSELPLRFRHMRESAAHPDAFTVAEPIGYDATTRTFWQQGLEAAALAEALDTDKCAALMARVARGLARLHTSRTRFGPIRVPSQLAASAHRRSAKIAHCMPELAQAAERVGAAIATHIPSDTVPLAQLHGDFHLEQLRVDGDRIVVFDLDEMAVGDPLEDLASFAVKCSIADRSLHLRVVTSLFSAYARCRDVAFDERRLDWHLAVQSLHKASRAYVWQRPGWRAMARAMLVQAEHCAARLGT